MHVHDRVKLGCGCWEWSTRAGRFECMSDARGISAMTDIEVLDYLAELQRERSRLDARMLRAMAHFHALRGTIADGKYAADEVAAALSWSPRTASTLVYT